MNWPFCCLYLCYCLSAIKWSSFPSTFNVIPGTQDNGFSPGHSPLDQKTSLRQQRWLVFNMLKCKSFHLYSKVAWCSHFRLRQCVSQKFSAFWLSQCIDLPGILMVKSEPKINRGFGPSKVSQNIPKIFPKIKFKTSVQNSTGNFEEVRKFRYKVRNYQYFRNLRLQISKILVKKYKFFKFGTIIGPFWPL